MKNVIICDVIKHIIYSELHMYMSSWNTPEEKITSTLQRTVIPTLWTNRWYFYSLCHTTRHESDFLFA